MLQLEELARAVGCLAERHDPCLSDQRLERTHIVEAVARLRRLERYSMATNPVDNGIGLLGFERGHGQQRKKRDKSSPSTQSFLLDRYYLSGFGR
jgi:hypothetical protein